MDRQISRVRNGLQIDGRPETPNTTAVTVVLKDSRGVLLAYGATVPSDAETGYAKGCIFIDTDATAGAVMLANEGDATSADFNTSLVSGDISSVVAGAGMTGGGVSGAVTLNVIADESTIEVTADEIHVKALGILAAHLGAGAATPTKTINSEARTATDTGATTGTVSAEKNHVVVTSAGSSKIIKLPAPVVGLSVLLEVGANGFDLITSDDATIAINGASGGGTKVAIPANGSALAFCQSATSWKVFVIDSAGGVVVKDSGITTAKIATGAVTPAKLAASEALTATADGLTTGQMTGNASHAVVTSGAATDAITLPASSAALVGKTFTIWVGANGFELLTPASSNATINGTDSDGTNQADIPASSLSRLTLVDTNTWLLENIGATGTVAGAIVPDND